ncbi:putative toxin-antitoxin system toxin component, PIN family [Candidatus Micrarchaeota archaeon]|nr:putative toxin-antitoxin system toxin component, PIN family [Candidatus Micrarchaeota archaeon]MBU1930699.1 putative toxin-antitoxin system toxin component, PIN family [Candidatus Micrarchaeota archaeon]
MLRVLIDTNIFLSGLFFKGNERKILEMAALGKIRLFLPEHVLIETQNIIQRKSQCFGNQPQALNMLKQITDKARIIPIREYKAKLPKANKLIRDPKDAPILAAVMSVQHDYFLSGDKDFQVLEIPTHYTTKEALQKIQKNKNLST